MSQPEGFFLASSPRIPDFSPPPPPSPPEWIETPTLIGTLRAGSALSVISVVQGGVIVARSWQRDSSLIAGADSAGYILTDDDIDSFIQSTETAAGEGGTSSRTTPPVGPILEPLYEVSTLEPAASWTGTAGTGFTSVPVDPVRVTAKPGFRLITPPFQWFTDTIDVGFMAAANESGSLLNTMGVASVKFFFEGSTLTVTEPGWHTIPTSRGNRTYFGWWARLKKPTGKSGHARLYAEATARDATMQKRVLGPYVFSPQESLYDAQITVTPSQPQVVGVNYQTLAAATAWCKASNRINPLITITESGIYTPGNATPETYTSHGYLNIEASVPGVTIGRPASAFVLNGNNDLNNDRAKLHLFGENITLDYRYVGAVALGSATPAAVVELSHWLDGITITNSDPLGNQTNWGGVPRDGNSITVIGQPWFTECSISNVSRPVVSAALVRGCAFERLFGDVLNGARAVTQNTFDTIDSDFWSDDRPAFSVQYTGAAATATLARSGGARGSGGGVWTLNIGGVATTYNTGAAPLYNGTGRYFTDLVAWLNTHGGITATLLIEPFDRAASSGSLAGSQGQGFAGVDIKTAPRVIVSNFDVHGDWYQHEAGTNLDNIVAGFNVVLEGQAQMIFLSPPNPAPRSESDVLFFCNVFHAGTASKFDPAISASQWGRPSLALPASHVVIAHNTFVNQRFLLRNDGGGLTTDAYCLLANNTMPSLTPSGGVAVPNLAVTNNHLHEGATSPAGATNTSVGGTPSTLFVDAALYDYTPAGELLSNLKTPTVYYDLNRMRRKTPAPAGAIRAPL